MKSAGNNQSPSSAHPLGSALALLVLVLFSTPSLLAQQIRSGAAYLKILPGTRQQNMAGSLTGSLDGIYSIYANPGATGLLRHWQFSASYNRWIAGISNTSLFYGQGFRLNTFLGDEINIGLGFNAQNVGNFDATGGSNFVSAQDILLNLSLGIPLTRTLPNLSIGTNIKYLRSELAQHSASTAALDVGFVYRTSRKSLNFLFADHFIFSFGAALTQLQLGKPLTFISDETPLPRTFRAGAAVNLGTHDGQQLQLAIDYRKVRDENKRFGLGVELINPFGRTAWVPELVIRGGHIFDQEHDDRLINTVSIGLSFRLDDYVKSFPYAKKGNHLFLKNAAFRVDGGFLGSTTFNNVYQGSLTYRPIGPEPFRFIPSDFMSTDIRTEPVLSY
ncbi:MAG: PorV/PorQ family protein, partial [bacterium]